MIDTDLLASVAAQLLSGEHVDLGGRRIRVNRTSAKRLKCTSFEVGNRRYEAIEQNPEKPSCWGELARTGHKVVQFKDAETNRFVAVAVDGRCRYTEAQVEPQSCGTRLWTKMNESVNRIGVNAVSLQKAVLCAGCETITDSPHDACLVCGSRSLLPLSRVLNPTTPVAPARRENQSQLPAALSDNVLVLTSPPHRLRQRRLISLRRDESATAAT